MHQDGSAGTPRRLHCLRHRLIAPNTGIQPQASATAGVANESDLHASTVLKSRSEVALMPVVVKDKHGRYISGLTRDAFHVEENGKEQSIFSFEEVKADQDKVSIPQPADGAYSNLPFDTKHDERVIIIVLDLLNTTPLQRVDGQEQLIRFLSKDLRHNEPISLLCIAPKGVRLLRPFTSDTASLVQALREVKIGTTWPGPFIEAVRETLQQLREIAHAYAD